MSLVLEAIARHAVERPERVALGSGGRTLAYRDLPRAVGAAARAIAALAPGRAPVGVALDNGPAWGIVDLVLLSLGRPSLPLPPFFTPDQAAHALADAGASALIRPALPGESGFEAFGEALAVQPLDHAPAVLPSGTAKVTYTSGSTGAPRGVCLSAAQMEATARAVVEVLGEDHAGVHVPVLPLAVLLENVAGLYPTLLAGGRYQAEGLAALGFADPFRPDFDRMADALTAAGATSLILVPELLRGLMGAIARGGRRPPDLTFVAVGGARVSPDLIHGARALGLPAHEGYGLTECASVVALNTPGHDRPGAVGRALPHHAVSIAPDGEILVGSGAFLGYVGAAAPSGPLRTGDLGRIDADGFLHVDGRKSNTLITAFGRNVSPEWVESELLGQPEIAQAAVFGDGEAELCALLVPSGPSVDAAALAAAVARANAGLPVYARVGAFSAGPPFDAGRGEVTGNGRVRRAALWSSRGHTLALPEPA